MVYQDVTRNCNLTPAAKGLYAYLSSFCGVEDKCYPSVDTITKEMGMGKDTFYRHINALVAAGVVKKHQTLGDGGKFGRTVYRLTHEVVINNFPITQNEDTDRPETAPKETNNNNTNNNNILNNNNSIICPEPENQVPDPSGILLPLNDKTTYNVPLSKIEIWTAAYPAVDVKQELLKMIAWLESNPARKKTRRGITRFIDSWLSREQDKGGRHIQQSGSHDTADQRNHTLKRPREEPEYYKLLGNRSPRLDDPFQ